MRRFQRLVYFSLLLFACNCTLVDKDAVNWNTINYAEIVCKNKPNDPGCKSPDNDIATSGRSKGK